MEVDEHRYAHGPISAVVHVQALALRGGVRQVACPDDVAPASEERGAQDAPPGALWRSRDSERVMRPQGASDDHHEPCSSGHSHGEDGNACRGTHVSVGEGERSGRSQPQPDDERQLVDQQCGQRCHRSEPSPRRERTSHTPGDEDDGDQVADRYHVPVTIGRHWLFAGPGRMSTA